MNITDCIVSLLKSGNAVELNGLGQFEIKTTDAYLDDSTNTFYPKTQTVTFHQYSEDKGNIIAIIAKKDCVDEQTAKQMWQNYSSALKEKLKNEHSHVFPEIGELRCDNFGNYTFEPVEGLNLLNGVGATKPLSGITVFETKNDATNPFDIFDNPVIPNEEPETENVTESETIVTEEPKTEPTPEPETVAEPEPEPELAPEPEPAVAEPKTETTSEPEPEPVVATEPTVTPEPKSEDNEHQKPKKKRTGLWIFIIILLLLLGGGAYYYFMFYQKGKKLFTPADTTKTTETVDTIANTTDTIATDTTAIDTSAVNVDEDSTLASEGNAEELEKTIETAPKQQDLAKVMDSWYNGNITPYTFDYSDIELSDPNAVENNRNDILSELSGQLTNYVRAKRYSTAVPLMKEKLSAFIDERLEEKFTNPAFSIKSYLSYNDYIRTSCDELLQTRRQNRAKIEVKAEIINDNLFATFLQELINAGLVKQDVTPKPKPITAPVFSNSKQGYDVIAGTFTDKNKAMSMAGRLKKKGCDAYVIEKGKFYYVSLGSASSRTQIERVLFQLKTWYTSNLAIKKW